VVSWQEAHQLHWLIEKAETELAASALIKHLENR
jgi:hypothetical protein